MGGDPNLMDRASLIASRVWLATVAMAAVILLISHFIDHDARSPFPDTSGCPEVFFEPHCPA